MPSPSETSSEARPARTHWDDAWNDQNITDIEPTALPFDRDATDRTFLRRLAELARANVLELGCGEGRLAVHLAQQGANVTAIDTSPAAVEIARRNACHNDVADRVSVEVLDATNLERLEDTFDLVTGRFVLHHIEPFDTFTATLDRVTTSNASGLFLENSARNRLLMFFRKYLTGRLGVPQYGDGDEYPLTPGEIDTLRSRFHVETHHPELVFLRKVNTYLLGYDNGWGRVVDLIESADELLYRLLPFLRKYSYLQLVELHS